MIRTTAITLSALALITWTAAPLAATPHSTGVLPSTDPVAGQYVVLLADGVARGPGADPTAGPTVAQVARALGRSHRAQVARTFDHAVQGFTAWTDPAGAQALAADPRVDLVEQDSWVVAASVQSGPPSWGLDRIDQRSSLLDSTFRYGGTGEGLRVFVVDTGIRSTHTEFGGRVATADGYTALSDGFGTEDCHGHGTHVSGIVGGSTFGAAKDVVLHPVRVLGCNGTGHLSDVIAGLDWVVAEVDAHQKGRPADRWRGLVVLSLGAPPSMVLDRAVVQTTLAGIPVVVAAGNGGADACASSPARVPEAIVVAATDPDDHRAAYSNGGPCVDLFAPGTGIVSSWIRHDSDAVSLSGTSTAAPHVAAVAATLMARHDWARPEDVERLLVERATDDAVIGAGDGTTDRLLYSAFLHDAVDDPPYATFEVDCDRRRACAFDAGFSFDEAGIASYAWDFGDGSSATRERTRHRYDRSAPGPYTVTLTVTDTAGQSSSHSVTVGRHWF